jgi:hypothetical protein
MLCSLWVGIGAAVLLLGECVWGGGGSYKIVNVACCWTYETAVLLGELM